MSLVSDVHQHIIVKLHQLKQAAVAELEALESAAQRILNLKAHVADLDTEIVGVARRIKDTGAHTLDWVTVPTIPEEAKKLLVANAPPPDVEAAPVQLLAEAVEATK